jgi:hypothetical protein
MSFAEVFEERIRKVFCPAWPKKPRLRKYGGKWVCYSLDGYSGHGVNPKMAYGAWQALRPDAGVEVGR